MVTSVNLISELNEDEVSDKRKYRGKTSFNPYDVKNLKLMKEAIELSKRNTRPAIIALITGMPQKYVVKLYKESHEGKVPHGIIPTCGSKHLRKPEYRMQSSMLLNAYFHFLNDGLTEGRSLIAAFDQYSEVFGETAKLCINRSYYLVRLVVTKQASMVGCGVCKIKYFVMNDQYLNNGKQCPVCHETHGYLQSLNKPKTLTLI